MKNIAIVGAGFVGSAVQYAFSTNNVQITLIDPKFKDPHVRPPLGTCDTYTDIKDVDCYSYDAIFVCVPTPMDKEGNIDDSIITPIIHAINDNLNSSLIDKNMLILRNKAIIVKSTVTPHIFKYWHEQSIDMGRLVYNPEFLRERSAQHDLISADFHVLGGYDIICNYVKELYENYSLCKPAPFYFMTMEEASYVKYAINCFLALKVTFFNQLYDSVKAHGHSFPNIVKAVSADPRIGPSHTRVPGFDGKQGYGGACFPKDMKAFTHYDSLFTLLEKAVIINNNYRQNYDLDDREKAQNVTYGQAKEEQ